MAVLLTVPILAGAAAAAALGAGFLLLLLLSCIADLVSDFVIKPVVLSFGGCQKG